MASGTPVTNTLAELYSVQRFMAPQVLEERGLDEFDAWAKSLSSGRELSLRHSGRPR
jgi:N12 class adenine-specific DNA methylase